MDFMRAALLGIMQGATEFLPISSSGHLVLVPWLLHWPDPGIVFDAIVHWGTLIAVVTYVHDDLRSLARAWLDSVRERRLGSDPQRWLAWLIPLGTIPIAFSGLFFQDFIEQLFSRPGWAATFLLITGSLLFFSDRWYRHTRSDGSDQAHEVDNQPLFVSPMRAVTGVLIIGLAQAVAIAPGISRSGATIAAGLFVGLGRREAARFSFLLAVPAILGAGALQLIDLVRSSTVAEQAPTLLVGFVTATITGYLAIRLLLRYLQRHTLSVFAVYCWAVGLLGLTVYWLSR